MRGHDAFVHCHNTLPRPLLSRAPPGSCSQPRRPIRVAPDGRLDGPDRPTARGPSGCCCSKRASPMPRSPRLLEKLDAGAVQEAHAQDDDGALGSGTTGTISAERRRGVHRVPARPERIEHHVARRHAKVLKSSADARASARAVASRATTARGYDERPANMPFQRHQVDQAFKSATRTARPASGKVASGSVAQRPDLLQRRFGLLVAISIIVTLSIVPNNDKSSGATTSSRWVRPGPNNDETRVVAEGALRDPAGSSAAADGQSWDHGLRPVAQVQAAAPSPRSSGGTAGPRTASGFCTSPSRRGLHRLPEEPAGLEHGCRPQRGRRTLSPDTAHLARGAADPGDRREAAEASSSSSPARWSSMPCRRPARRRHGRAPARRTPPRRAPGGRGLGTA